MKVPLALPCVLVRICALWLVASAIPAVQALDPARPVKDYRIAEWGVPQGLPYPSVAALAQTPDGYIWIGTRTGLARFDGIAFTTFNSANRPELADERITSLYVATDGTLWVGTGRGVTLYRSGRWTRPKLGTGVDDGGIMGFVEGADHSIFISQSLDRATARSQPSGIYRYRNGQCSELHLPDGTEVPRIDQMARLSSGEVVLAGRGLFRVDGDVVRDVGTGLGIKNPQFVAMIVGGDDTAWLGGTLGLIKWIGGTHVTFSAADGMPSNSVRSLAPDSDGNLWVGTSNGLARYRDGKFQPLLVHGIEPLSNVLSQLEDAEHNLWVGTDNGLFRVQDVKVTTLGARDGLPVNPILCILPAKDGTNWVGTIGGGLAHVTPDGVRTLHIKDGLREDSIGALAEDSDGAGLWIGYYTRGVSHYRDGKFTHYAPGDPVRFRGLAVDPEGTVWAASSAGLFRLYRGNFESVALDPALSFPRALHIDREAGVWVAGGRAYGRLHRGHWTVFRKPSDLDSQAIQSIFSDSTGSTWVLIDGPALLRVRHGKEERFDFPKLGPLIYSGFEDRGELWINFRAGVARIPLREFDQTATSGKPQPRYTLYTEADGMRSLAPNVAGSPGSSAQPDGTLWFSTSMGIAILSPDHIRLNQIPPNVVIERVLADKREYHGADLTALPPGRGELAVHFTALSFTNPPQVRFRYRLQGFDADWIDAGQSRVAYYGGLQPGRYRFEVTACNNEGIWNRAGASCDLVLRPHFYQRRWFFAAIGLMVSGAGFALYGWRSRHLERKAQTLQRQNDDLERRISERTAELRQSYDALRSSEYFYHSLVESLPHVIVRKDATGRYTYANGAAAELLGRPLPEIIGHADDEILPPESAAKEKAADHQVLELRQPMEREDVVERDGVKKYLHVKRVPLYDAGHNALGVQVLYWDMTVFRETEDKLKHAQRELLDISRRAGIAEVATGVLHNLGNAMNSVKVAATVAREKARHYDIKRVRLVADMLAAERGRLGDFFATDARAAKLPEYMKLVSEQLESQQQELVTELKHLSSGIEHVAIIIAAQQAGARVTGILEQVAPAELVEYACRMEEALVDRNDVILTREFMAVPPIAVERQKVLQIIGNLIRNAIDSVVQSGRPDKRVTLTVRPRSDGGVEIAVTDNGLGIAPENRTRIFQFGFTTKPDGHGFGLHNSAVAAQEAGGDLGAQSDGPGHGATFTLVLPPAPPQGSSKPEEQPPQISA